MALAYESKVPASYRTEFVAKVRAICSRLGINPDWLMIVMDFESAGRFTANVTNGSSGAVGLIQFTESGIVGLGVTLAQLKAMTAVQQLDYVEKYLAPYKSKFRNVYDVYLAVFAPAYIGKEDATVVYSKFATTDIGKRRYELNKALDSNGDGYITIWEINQVIRNRVPFDVDSGVTPENKVVPILALSVLFFLFFKRS